MQSPSDDRTKSDEEQGNARADDEPVKSTRWTINQELLPLKTFYFFFYGACGTVIPFIPVYLKFLNVTASEIGIITGTAVLLCIFTRPAIGLVADKLNVRKQALIFCSMVFGLAFFSMWFIPGRSLASLSTDKSKDYNLFWACPENFTSYSRFCPAFQKTHPECFTSPDMTTYQGTVQNPHDLNHMPDGKGLSYSVAHTDTQGLLLHCFYVILSTPTHFTGLSNLTLYSIRDSIDYEPHLQPPNEILSECFLWNCTRISSSILTKSEQNVTIATPEETVVGAGEIHVSLDAVFLVSFALLLASRAFYSSSTSLVDAVTYTILGNDRLKWGEQRLWGTLGTAFAVLTVTALNDSFKGLVYAPLFCMCLLLTCLACVVGIAKLKCGRVPKNERFLQDIWSVLKSPAVRLYFCKLLLFGMLCGSAQNFFLWFIMDIDGKQITLGLLLLVNCFSSVVVLRFTKRVLGFLGQQRAMQFVLCCYAARYLAFSLLPIAWLALPVEILHGITYSMFWAVASSTASLVAPPGTQATCQGLAGAIYWDMGRGLGTLITGQLIQLIGPRATFRYYAIACAAALPMCCFLDHVWSLNKVQTKQTGETKENISSAIDKELSASCKLLDDRADQKSDKKDRNNTQAPYTAVRVDIDRREPHTAQPFLANNGNAESPEEEREYDPQYSCEERPGSTEDSSMDISSPLLENDRTKNAKVELACKKSQSDISQKGDEFDGGINQTQSANSEHSHSPSIDPQGRKSSQHPEKLNGTGVGIRITIIPKTPL